MQNTIGKDESQYLEYDFPVDEGFIIEISVTTGKLILYGSFNIRNPSPLTADFTTTSDANGELQYFVSPELYSYASSPTEVTKRQIADEPQLYIAVIGLGDVNTFLFNTTFGDVVPPSVVSSSVAPSSVTPSSVAPPSVAPSSVVPSSVVTDQPTVTPSDEEPDHAGKLLTIDLLYSVHYHCFFSIVSIRGSWLSTLVFLFIVGLLMDGLQ